jgi:hypothetical protein
MPEMMPLRDRAWRVPMKSGRCKEVPRKVWKNPHHAVVPANGGEMRWHILKMRIKA